MYRYTNDANMVVRVEGDEFAFIPCDPSYRDYMDFLDWVSKGNVPQPVPVSIPDPVLTARLELEQLERTTMMNRGMREYLLVSMQDLAMRQAEMTNAELEASGSTSRVSAQDILAANSAWVKLVEINSKATELRAIINKTT